MKTDAQKDVILNVVAGVMGALPGGWLISPLVGAGTINKTICASRRSSIILAGIVNLIRRGKAR